ncbi:MAG: Hpt domain-containing protein, partial [Geminicoccaceae bacterium]
MKGDQERCLESGMDDYATKPIRKRNLVDILMRWCVARENRAAQATVNASSSLAALTPDMEAHAAPPVIEPAASAPSALPPLVETATSEPSALDSTCLDDMRAVMGDQFKAILEFYLEDAANYLDQIKGGLQSNDGEAIVAAAHPLKSSSRELGVAELSDLAKRIEETVRNADGQDSRIASIGPLVKQLDVSFDKARSELEVILQEAA